MATNGYLTLMKTLLAVDPDDPATQRLCVAAADLQPAGRRTDLLKKVACADRLEPGVRQRLSVDRTDAVRAAVWARSDWDAESLAAALDADSSAPTRRAVIRNDAATPALLERAATPLLKSLAEPVLDRPDLAPVELLLTAMTLVRDQATGPLSEEKTARFAAAARTPGVAEALLGDPDMPLRLRVWALSAASPSDEQVLDALDSFPDRLPGPPSVVREISGMLERALPIYHDRSVDVAARFVAKHHGWSGQTSRELVAAHEWATLTRPEQLLRQLQRSRHSPDALRRLIEATPPEEMSSGVIREILLYAQCTSEVAATFTTTVPGATAEDLVRRVWDAPDDLGPRPWMCEHPELFLRYAEHTARIRLHGLLRAVADRPETVELLARHLCAHPRRFPDDVRPILWAGLPALTLDQLADAPWIDLTAALRLNAIGDERQAAIAETLQVALRAIDTGDHATAVRRAKVMESLMGAPSTPTQVCTAALALEDS